MKLLEITRKLLGWALRQLKPDRKYTWWDWTKLVICFVMLMAIWVGGMRFGYHHGRIDEQAFQQEQDRFNDDIHRRMPDFN